MNKIKALFFDVDGTIYTHRNHDIPESTKTVLKKLKENGYKIGIATSRCRYEVKNLPIFFQNFDFDAQIFDGGALVLDHGEIMEKHPIAKHQVEKLSQLSKLEDFTMRYATYDGDFFEHTCNWEMQDNFFKLYLNIPIVKAYDGEEVFNMLAFIKNKEQEKLIRQTMDRCDIVKHTDETFEITAYGIDKTIGVKRLCEHWNISMEEVICFGDGANDVKMLKEAGIGIALGNADEQAKQVADKICGHIDEDGVYNICKALNLF